MRAAWVVAVAIAALVVGLFVEHHGGVLGGLAGLLRGGPATVEKTEQEADDAGQKAAEEKRDELDAETDDEVVDDSGAADTVRDDERTLSTDANAAERDAESDLDRRLRGDGDG